MWETSITRRKACQVLVSSAALSLCSLRSEGNSGSRFRLNYSLASSLYGCLPLSEILPEVAKVGASTIDLWPMKHGNQREQVDEMGSDAFRKLLDQHQVTLGMTTRYDLGPFRLADEIEFVSSLGGRLIVTGAPSTKIPATREQIQDFVGKLAPVVRKAEEHQVQIAIENHSNSLLERPDTLRYFAEAINSPALGIAFAPYHLPQDPELLKSLIIDLGPGLKHFYAWEHGDGCMTKLPKEQELKQLPGRGPLDFAPLLSGLKEISFTGWTQIFMHPTPRGIPIQETASEVTATLNESRQLLDKIASSI